ncbi:HEAT repeat domain-containing protein [Saccharopolyspora hirsuta]|uniref:HEAT repeat domain-containing protein n=1 Tax=Saccharopolyspora hirsuta TaxID=1837 RepID=A0A5M7C226_SACHI|nr:HEAT repeat domain-containing protein [Saccharopolyspora hirsuta]KAA5835992.1 HEAT repeat domain-containing protein [Saccharopolyspora hirsuta]
MALKDHVTMAEVNEFAAARGWTELGTMRADPGAGVFFEKKWQVRDELSLHYVVDDLAGERYVLAMGPDPDAELAELTSGLDTWTISEAAFNFDASVYRADKDRAVRLLGVVSPADPTRAIIDRVTKAARSDHSEIRHAAVLAMAYAEWPDYRRALEDLVERETDEAVLLDAQDVLSALNAE